jgi:N-acetylmuramoyl-L-alanine amidase
VRAQRVAIAIATGCLAVAACGDGDDASGTAGSPGQAGGTAAETGPAADGSGGGGPAPGGSAGGGDSAGRCNRIVIDPGHDSRPNPATEPIGPGSSRRKIKDGGGTSGVVTGVPEHVVNLQVSRRLRKLLEARGYCVKMTRDRATGVSMGNVARARIANRFKAALFVRIHADGSTDRRRNGSSVLYPALRRRWTDDILPESKTAARRIQPELVRGLGSKDLGIVPRSDLTGFNWADVPSVLVELGFLSNPREDRRLTSARYQQRAARGLERGIARFVPPRQD